MRILMIAVIICLSVSGCGTKNTAQDRELVKIREIEKNREIGICETSS